MQLFINFNYRYDPKFGDAFWDSSKYSLLHYIFRMMSSWAIVCDIWYMPPMCREDGETAIDFANRVKRAIAEQGGLVDLEWYVFIFFKLIHLKILNTQNMMYFLIKRNLNNEQK